MTLKKTPTVLDRLPPHDLNAERAVIGCALHDATLAAELRVDWFYDVRHREAAGTLLRMATDGHPIDHVTVFQALAAAGIPEAATLVSDCDNACPSAANFSYWRDILTGKLTLRRIIQQSHAAIADAYEAGDDPAWTPADSLDEFERGALSLRQLSAVGDGEVDKLAALRELEADYDAAKNGHPRGLATGFRDLDTVLDRMQPQELIILAARPSVGKTALATGMAERMALGAGVPVGFFSLEMSGKSVLHRLVSSQARVDGALLRRGEVNEAQILASTKVMGRIGRAPLHICEQGGLTLAQLAARARRMVQRHGIQVVFVDYLGQLRSGRKGGKLYEEITFVSNGLKALAKELNLPVIVLAQLNRDSEKEERLPRLSDLRDSGAIEQDADIVVFLHRDQNQTGERQEIKAIVAKQRNGRTGMVELAFERGLTRFEDKSVGE